MTGLIVALDVRSAEEAVRLARSLQPHVAGFQVGAGLLAGPGPAVIGALARVGPVLADAALHTIASQAGAAARRLGEFGARWVTAHASGGVAMLEAAAEGLAEGAAGRDAGILAITVPTGLDGAALAAAGLGGRPGKLVSRLARLAAAAGAEGSVCAVQELGVVAEVAPGLRRVVAGVRGEGASPDDHARVSTWEDAARRGAHQVVAGRPILSAEDPAVAAAQIAESLRSIGRGGDACNRQN